MGRPKIINDESVMSEFGKIGDIKKVADSLHISYSSVRNILHKNKVVLRRGRRKGVTANEPRPNSKTAAIIQAINRGKLTDKQICTRYSVSRQLLHTAKKRWHTA